MKLFWAPQTRASRAVWMLEEAAVAYELEEVDIRAAERRDSAEFLAASPMGKVPALVDGDVRMADSTAICLYIADRYRPGELAPAIDHPLRGRYLYWMIYTPGVIEPAMSEKFHAVEPNRQRSGWGDFELMLTTLEDALRNQRWILGEQFSAADVMLGSSVVFLRTFDMLPDSAVLSGYADRCLARAAYARALAREPAQPTP